MVTRNRVFSSLYKVRYKLKYVFLILLLNELSPVRQLPGASTRARVEVEEIEKSADRHIGYECYE